MPADSSINLKTRIDDSGITSGLKKIKKELAEAQRSYTAAEKAYAKVQSALSKSPHDKKLNSKSKSLEGFLDKSGPELEAKRETYENLLNVEPIGKNIDKATAKLNSLLDKKGEMEALGVDKESTQWKRLSYQIDEARKKLIGYYNELESRNPGSTVDLRAALDNLAPSTEKARDLKNSLSGIVKNANAFVSTGIHRFLGMFSKKAGESDSAAKKLGRGIFSLGNMFRLLVLRMAMRAAIKALQEGFKNLAAYSSEANETLSSLQNNGTYLANSLATAFQPLAQVVASVFSKIVDWIASAVNALNKFFAILGGKSSYTVAVKQNKKYAASAKGAAKATKEEESALASFDEINQLHLEKSSGNGGGGGAEANPNEMFKKVDTGVASEFELQTAEKLKAIWADLVKTAQNLGEAWQEAWEYNGNGLRITESLQGMWLDLLDNIKQITGATERWSESLTFIPLMSALADLFESLRPILNDIGQIGVWIYENVILPIAKWEIENEYPALLELIAAGLDVIHQIFEALAPVMQVLYDEVLAPLAESIGEIIVGILTAAAEGLKKVAAWLEKHHKLTTVLIAVVHEMGKAVREFKLVLKGVLQFITGVFTGDWKKAWEGIKNVFKGIWNTIASICESVVNGIIKALNAISFDTPDWLPFLGGKHFGFNLPTISIPRLATGTVVPPHAGEFAAILGDNKTDTEVVSPLETMKEAVLEALRQNGNAGGQQISIRFDGNLAQLARVLKPYIESENKRSGVNLVLDVG